MNPEVTLHEAAIRGDKHAIELLLKSSANVNSLDSRGQTALQLAAKHGRREIVQLLIEKGVNVNVKD